MSNSFAEDYKGSRVGSDKFTPPDEITVRFDVLERLAENDCGETFLLTDKASGKRFVLKCYRKNSSAGETREAEILRSLSHDGLPGFETEIEEDGALYVLREYAEGMPLDQYIENAGGRLDAAHTVSIALKLCDILDYLHSRTVPVIHRDVKPANIIINTVDNSIKLIDFGISRRFSENADNDTMCYGTKKFSPPEQYGYSQTDCRADIYALGVVLRYMLTGAPDGETDNKKLSRIIDKCTAFSPDDRYQSAAALKNDLLRYQNGTRGKVLKAVAVGLAICASLAVGFCVGRYTDLLRVEEAEALQLEEKTPIPAPIQTPTPTPDVGEEPVTFVEPLIEEAVRVMLGKTDDEPIYQSELIYVTELYIFGMQASSSWDEHNALWGSDVSMYGTISKLDDLVMLKTLREIDFIGQPVRDISPLADCPLLESVHIDRSPITDISPLTELTRLMEVGLSCSNIGDLSPLADIRLLEHLYLCEIAVDDYTQIPAHKMTGLLNVNSQSLVSLEGIDKFTNLSSLDVVNTGITDFSLLDDVPNIRRLWISSHMEQYLDTLTRDDIEVVVQ